MNIKKVFVSMLSIALLISAQTYSVSAAYETPVELTTEVPTFNLTLPTNLPIAISSTGSIVTADNIKVVNNSTGPVKISDIKVNGLSGYSIKDYTKVISILGKNLAMQINGMTTVDGGGSIVSKTTPTEMKLLLKGELPIIYSAQLSFHSTAEVLNPAEVVFTAEFDKLPDTPSRFPLPRPKPPIIPVDPHTEPSKPEPPSFVEPPIGETVTIGDYEYVYGQYFEKGWTTPDPDTESPQHGYGVRVLDQMKNSYPSPLTDIKGVPVTNLHGLFENRINPQLTLVKWDTKNITDMSEMFYNCGSWYLDISSFNTSRVTDMRMMFASSGAISINVSGIDTSNVYNMSSMFSGSEVESIDLSKLDTSRVTDMSYMFSGTKFIELDLSKLNTSSVTDMSGMFAYNETEILDLSNFNTSRVTNMSRMFELNRSSSINMLSFDTSNVTDMSSMFSSVITRVLDLSSFDVSRVKKMDLIFGHISMCDMYARSKKDMDILNALSSMDKNSGLKFKLK